MFVTIEFNKLIQISQNIIYITDILSNKYFFKILPLFLTFSESATEETDVILKKYLL